ncbi:MAG: pitrilysin family protein [Thermoanaerobaculia bacterium]
MIRSRDSAGRREIRGLGGAGGSAAVERSRLDNGLELCQIVNRQAPIVTTVLLYKVGGRDEAPGESGSAHFLEHMMFKGSAHYGPGEIDRRTQALGGNNNAFTSHDLTAYYFSFSADRWHEALAIERDRMTALTLDAQEVASERQVILEELAMYRDEPWDALELEVQAMLFASHPYATPVLGSETDLAAIDRGSLARFERRFYVPRNALLVLAGDLGSDAGERVLQSFGDLDSPPFERPAVVPLPALCEALRVERRHGEVARLLLALPAPAPDHPDHAGLRLLATLLGGGRTSRLHRALVDVGQVCLAASCSVAEAELASHVACSLEVLPDGDAADVEIRLQAELAALRDTLVDEEELERGKSILLADWVFQQERIHQQAITAALALAHGDLTQPETLVRRALECDAPELQRLARRYLDPAAGSVFGLSLPESSR